MTSVQKEIIFAPAQAGHSTCTTANKDKSTTQAARMQSGPTEQPLVAAGEAETEET